MRRARASVALLMLLLTGCGSASSGGHSASAPPSTLPAAAVPYLASAGKPLTPRLLVREAQAPALAAALRRWGFRDGAERYFQGESHRLQVVDSRTLRFASPPGAQAFVKFMRLHLTAYVGSFPKLHPLAVGPRRGFLAVGQECQCHLANPTFLAVVWHGGGVTWLEINGPGATPARLISLLAHAP
jgi:hypothetical protein